MCGIVGFVTPPGAGSIAHSKALGLSMARAIEHRGPDDADVWSDDGLGVTLAHRRLSIVDLSVEGRQPMTSASGRYVIAFNGEIYNYPELRAELEQSGKAPAWRGHSDTEVFLAACDAWGVAGATRRANGMFAMAIVDLAEKRLLLTRDRMGEKPLYYGWQGAHFLFGSELKALRVHPGFRNQLDAQVLPSYIRFGYVPSPFTIYAGIHKLPAGSVLNVSLRRGARTQEVVPYWEVPLPSSGDELQPAEAIDQLHTLLRDAVKIRMHSDVPLGAFLSGGVDSSTIVALMQAQSARPIRTYSIGFREKSHDEAGFARAVAKVLATDHTELYVTSADALAVVPHLADIYDEPFADSSQIPTYLLAKLTRQHVTVALSGDGGDELFGGYMRYVQGRTLLRMYDVIPHSWRQACAYALNACAGPRWDRLASLGPRRVRALVSSDRLSKLAEVFALGNYRDLYRRLVSQWSDPSLVVPSVPQAPSLLDDEGVAANIKSPLAWMMYIDKRTYLPDDILVKIDRASMAVALEARVPFLDHRLVEFAARLPLAQKLRDGQGKWLLRQVLYKYIDRRLIDRPKQGFGVPIEQWLRGPLREWAEDLLSHESLAASGMLDPAPIRRAWLEHVNGQRNLHYPLWVILMFQAWLRSAAPVTPVHS